MPKGIYTNTPFDSVPGISAVPHEDNLRYFDVEIHGPSQSPYEGSERTIYYNTPFQLASSGLTVF